MENTNEQNTMKSFLSGTFGDSKISKELELNETMSVKPNAPDEYTKKIMNLGGNE